MYSASLSGSDDLILYDSDGDGAYSHIQYVLCDIPIFRISYIRKFGWIPATVFKIMLLQRIIIQTFRENVFFLSRPNEA